MALLLILFALFAFLGLGHGSTGVERASQSSSATGSATATASASSTVTQSSVQTTNGLTRSTCIVVTWKAGQPAHKRPCHKAPAKP